jgi:hypothetical protein
MFTKICVGVPTYDGKINPETLKCLESLDVYNNTHGKGKELPYVFEVRRAFGSSSLYLRNTLAGMGSTKTRQKLPYDFYLSIDADMVFNVGNIINLVKTYERLKKSRSTASIGIIGGAYIGRGPVICTKICAGHFEGVPGHSPYGKWLPIDTMGVKEVDWTGTGFMLVAKDVLESMDYPWFRANVIVKDDDSNLTTEDIGISMDVKKSLRRTVYCDCSNRIGHIIQ